MVVPIRRSIIDYKELGWRLHFVVQVREGEIGWVDAVVEKIGRCRGSDRRGVRNIAIQNRIIDACDGDGDRLIPVCRSEDDLALADRSFRGVAGGQRYRYAGGRL